MQVKTCLKHRQHFKHFLQTPKLCCFPLTIHTYKQSGIVACVCIPCAFFEAPSWRRISTDFSAGEHNMGPRTGNKPPLISWQKKKKKKKKIPINMLDVQAAVVKVTDDTALSLAASASSTLLPLSSTLSPPIHQAGHWAGRKGKGDPTKTHIKLLFIHRGEFAHLISLVLITESQLP